MKKEGLIIAAMAGMGQEVYTSVFDKHLLLNLYDYQRGPNDSTHEDVYIEYAMNAIAAVSETGWYDVVFIEPRSEVLAYLNLQGKAFIVAYPGCTKDKILRNLASTYLRNPSTLTGKAMAETIISFDTTVARLRGERNSIMFSTGLLNHDVITQMLTIAPLDRATIINSLGVKKQQVLEEISDRVLKNNINK